MSFPNQWLQHTWFIHLGWALVHFLWQGTSVALLLAAALRAMRKQSAEARYAAACAAMVLMAALPAFTLAALVHRADSSSTSILTQTADLPAARGGGLAVAADHTRTPFHTAAERIVFLANQSLPWLVVVWAIGALLLLARLIGGYVGVARARREAAPISNWVIRSRLIALSLRMGIPRTVQLLESAYVTGPAVIGVLRPAVLFPIAALTGLWPIQVEAILAHELAHIRRHDYLVNLIQSVVETLLFYHPAVWWVSTRIRQEREHCCDDLAVKACGNNVFYATALADLDDLRMPAMTLAVAATGGALLPRIRRLIMPPPNRAANGGFWAGGALAGVLLMAALAAGIAGSGSSAQGHPAAAMHAPTIEPVPTIEDWSRQGILEARLNSDLAPRASDPVNDREVVDGIPPVQRSALARAVEILHPMAGASPWSADPAAVSPDDQPGELIATLPQPRPAQPADAVPAAADLKTRTVVARRQFHRSTADPTTAIPMSIPAEIVAFIRRDSGYWPLGATSIHATPNGGHHVILSGKTNNQSSAERGWTVRASEQAPLPEGGRIRVVGAVRLSIDPGCQYSIPFEVEMQTEPNPRASGQLATNDASVTWYEPTINRVNVSPPVPPVQPVVQTDAPDLMLHPASASWDLSAAPVFGTLTSDNSPAARSMTRAGLATPAAGATQGLVQRNSQPLIRDSSKSDQKN